MDKVQQNALPDFEDRVENYEGMTSMPPDFSLSAGEDGRNFPETNGEVGKRYEEGNRPNPSSSTGSVYEIRSSQGAVLKVGDWVQYRLHQKEVTLRSGNRRISVEWSINNGATGRGVDALEQGPNDSWTFGHVKAKLPGVHTIQAKISLDGIPQEIVSFQQVVESGENEYQDLLNVRPSKLDNLDDLVSLVRRIEAAYPAYSWQDITSKIRKQFYPGPHDSYYSELLVAFTWNDLFDEKDDLEPLKSPPCNPADIAALRPNTMIEGVDLGHILAGVDSMNFPETARVYPLFGISGPAAATWAGDVGSALVYWANEEGIRDKQGAQKEKYYLKNASIGDLLGDIDSINLAEMPSLGKNAPLSVRLQTYYQSDPGKGVQQRFHRFCEVSGFSIKNGKLSNEAKAYIKTQIMNFSKAFNLGEGFLGDLSIRSSGSLGGGVFPSFSGNYELTSSHQIATHLDWFVNRFIQDIENGLAQEKIE